MVRIKEGETRTYTIPLRRDFVKAPKWRRSKRAVNFIQSFLERHTKKEDVKIGRWLNELVWKHGAKNPPSRVRVNVTVKDNTATAELVDLPPKAKRIIEAEKKAAEEAEKKKSKKTEAVPEETEEKPKAEKKVKAPSKKKQEKKASKKELQKELEAAKEAEKKKEQKKRAAPSRKQEMKMNK